MPDFLAEALTWNDHYHLAVAIETALQLNKAPLSFILTERSVDEWTALDKKLAVAFTLMNKEVCQSCGQPIWICRNSDRNIDFSVRAATCYAKAAIEKKEESRSKQKNGKLKHGEYLYVVPMQVNGKELEKGTRSKYFQSLAEE